VRELGARPERADDVGRSSVDDVQAEPDESALSLLSPISTDSPSTYANEMFRLCGSRRSGCPFRYASSTCERIMS